MSSSLTARPPRRPSPDHAELVRFLLARIDQEEGELRRQQRRLDALPVATASAVKERSHLDTRRRDCTGRRRIIGVAQHLFVLRDQPQERVVRDAAYEVLQALSLPYAAHPQYRRVWAFGNPASPVPTEPAPGEVTAALLSAE